MSLDRTKPPPIVVGEPMFGEVTRTWYVYLHDDSGHDRIHADTAEECLQLAWAEYDRITLPARVALLEELAAKLTEHVEKPEPPSDNEQLVAAREAYAEGVRWAIKVLRWAGDKLERESVLGAGDPGPRDR